MVVGSAGRAVTAFLSSQEASRALAHLLELRDDVLERQVLRPRYESKSALRPSGGVEDVRPSERMEDLGEIVSGHVELIRHVVDADGLTRIGCGQIHNCFQSVDRRLRENHRVLIGAVGSTFESWGAVFYHDDMMNTVAQDLSV